MKPILSIVIANYNYGRFLEDAIRSVLMQNVGPAIELIVCDGGSTDNSVAIIKKYANEISWWCSERDTGQSAAFNKGFSHARGEWLTWLNADEMYARDMLPALLRFIKRNPKAQWITGNYANFDNRTRRITHVTWGPHLTMPFVNKNHYPNAVFGSSSFWKRELYDKMGPIDERLHYGMDTEYWNRLAMAGYKHYRFNHYCWLFRDHDASKTVGVQDDVSVERRRKEDAYQHEKTGYTFRYSISNFWFDLWLVWRLLDMSLFVRIYKRWRFVGKDLKILA